MDSRILIVFFTFLMTGCNVQNSKKAMTAYRYNDCIVDSITMQHRNMEKYQELLADKESSSLTYEELLQQYDYYTVDKEDWGLILDVVTTAVYDEKQYDKVKNPNGYMLKIGEQDFTIFIHCLNELQYSIAFWPERILIDGKWYRAVPSKRAEFDTMISKYTE